MTDSAQQQETKYKILQQASNGWYLIEDSAQNLTKGQCDRMLKTYIRGGENPNDLRAVLQNDPRYPTTNNGPGWVPQNL
tara:strand:+ start:469 stop:705 length:237 start_codon:yes stop_codon:yes gene_type:complete